MIKIAGTDLGRSAYLLHVCISFEAILSKVEMDDELVGSWSDFQKGERSRYVQRDSDRRCLLFSSCGWFGLLPEQHLGFANRNYMHVVG